MPWYRPRPSTLRRGIPPDGTEGLSAVQQNSSQMNDDGFGKKFNAVQPPPPLYRRILYHAGSHMFDRPAGCWSQIGGVCDLSPRKGTLSRRWWSVGWRRWCSSCDQRSFVPRPARYARAAGGVRKQVVEMGWVDAPACAVVRQGRRMIEEVPGTRRWAAASIGTSYRRTAQPLFLATVQDSGRCDGGVLSASGLGGATTGDLSTAFGEHG